MINADAHAAHCRMARLRIIIIKKIFGSLQQQCTHTAGTKTHPAINRNEMLGRHQLIDITEQIIACLSTTTATTTTTTEVLTFEDKAEEETTE